MAEIPKPKKIDAVAPKVPLMPSQKDRTIEDSLGFLGEMRYIDQSILEEILLEETKKFEKMKLEFAALDLVSTNRMSLDQELLKMQEKIKGQGRYLAFLEGLLE